MIDEHVDLDDLAVRALDGLPVTSVQQRHLEGCAECRAEHEALRSAAAAGRRMAGEPGTPDPAPVAPGAAVWTRIAGELGMPDAAPSATAADPEGSAPLPLPPEDRSSGGLSTSGLPPDGLAPHQASAEEMARVRRVPLAWLSLAAVLVVLAVVASSVVLLGRPDAQRVEIVLAPLDGGEPATATIRDAADGRTLEVTLPEARATSDSFYELWLIDTDVEGMVSLGPLVQEQTTVVVPDGLDLSRFPIVDVSVEPFDGEPRHSGDSRWRGTVPA